MGYVPARPLTLVGTEATRPMASAFQTTEQQKALIMAPGKTDCPREDRFQAGRRSAHYGRLTVQKLSDALAIVEGKTAKIPTIRPMMTSNFTDQYLTATPTDSVTMNPDK
jgi:hypothetical protein